MADPQTQPVLARTGLLADLRAVEGSRRWVRRAVFAGLALALLTLLLIYRARTARPPKARYLTGEVARGDVVETVQSTGQVKPVTEVQVGAQVSGRITRVHVDFNSQVRAGDVLAEIDPTLFGAAIDSTRAQMTAAGASLSRARANLETARTRLDRARKLRDEGIGSQADVDAAQNAHDIALADVAAARASITQVDAQLRSNRTSLEYTKIYSPIDGLVIHRAVDPGQTVAASFQAPTLFVIAQDLRKMRVLADVDEADVGRLREGMPADATVDAFPGEVFHGTVSQVRFSPNNVAGVVTYSAVIEVENPELKLRPGMTATVTVRSAEARGALRVPNSALRFKPSPPRDGEGKAVPQEPLPALAPRTGRLWLFADATPGQERLEPRVVEIGITDGIHTVLLTDLPAGTRVATDETDEAGERRGRGPRMF